MSARERPALGPFIALPTHLPVAPRPLVGELLSSWLGRLAAASALSFEELLEALRVRLAPSRSAEFYPGRLDYGCSRPLTKALSTLSRWPAARIAALDLKRRFGTLGLWWLNHDANHDVFPFSRAKHRPQVLPSYCGPPRAPRRNRAPADWVASAGPPPVNGSCRVAGRSASGQTTERSDKEMNLEKNIDQGTGRRPKKL